MHNRADRKELRKPLIGNDFSVIYFVNTNYEKGDRVTSIYSYRIGLKMNVCFGKLGQTPVSSRLPPFPDLILHIL